MPLNPNLYRNFYDPYGNHQYGVSSPFSSYSGVDQATGAFSGLAGMIPFIGPIFSAMMNVGASIWQDNTQRSYYEDYMSPQARMAQMKAAGINPALAAQGIAGSASPSMAAPAASNAFSDLGSQLGNSVNTALSSEAIRASIAKTNAETEFTKSLNTGQTIENAYKDSMQRATLYKLQNEGDITRSQANMISQDEFYHGEEAKQHFEQTMLSTQMMSQELKNMEQEFLNECAQYQLIMVNIGKTQAEISEIWSRVGLNNAMIEEIGHRIDLIDAETALTYNKSNGQILENEIIDMKGRYEKKAWDVFESTGFDMKSSVNQNYLRLCAEGKTDEANNLMNGVYQYSQGQYGAKSDQVRKWIGTGTGALATVAGAIMLFVPGLQAAGAATGVAGISLIKGSQGGTRTYNNGLGRRDFDGNWNSLE